MRTKNLQMLKLNLEKAEEPEMKFQTSVGSYKKQENFRKTSTSAVLSIGLVSKVAAKWKAKNAENNENAVNSVNAVNEPDPSLFPG